MANYTECLAEEAKWVEQLGILLPYALMLHYYKM